MFKVCMLELPDHAHAAHLLSLFYIASVSIEQLIMHKSVRNWCNTSCPYSIFTVCSEVKIFVILVQNVYTNYTIISIMQNIPLYGIDGLPEFYPGALWIALKESNMETQACK